MRQIIAFLFGFFCLFAISLSAQTPACQASPQYADSLSGVYPMPFHPTDRPSGGITRPACINRAYSFVWTIKVGDTIQAKVAGQTVQVPLDSVTLATTGAIENLPTGITYACNPPNCVWKKRTTGCVVISGTPTASNAIKDYSLKISGKVFSPDATLRLFFPNGYPVTFPGDLFPGEYILKLYANNDTRCTTSAFDKPLDKLASHVSPNPLSDFALITVNALTTGTYSFQIFDVTGKSISERKINLEAGTNTLEFKSQNFESGLYFYRISDAKSAAQGKLVIH
jgi:hypothetical protein